MTITTVFDPPLPTDSTATFNGKAFDTMSKLNAWTDEANNTADAVNNDAAAAAASQAAASASASAAGTANSSAQIARAAAEAAAGATGSVLPAQAAYNRSVLRTDQGNASWGTYLGPAVRLQHSPSARQLLRNTASLGAPWASGAGITVTYQYQGPNGLAPWGVTCTGVATSGLTHAVVPVQGQQRTLSVWWRGLAKPAAGHMLYAEYRDAANVMQFASLLWSDASVVADGKWRRYSVTYTHAGSNLAPLNVGVCSNTSAGTWYVTDYQLVDGAVPRPYVATCESYSARVDENTLVLVDTQAGPVSVLLPTPSPTVDRWVEIKDMGYASINKITVERGANLIEGQADDMEITRSNAKTRLVYTADRGYINT